MFNFKLKQNIKALDVEISKIGKELEELDRDTRYDVRKRTLEDLIELRNKLMVNQREDESNEAVEELNKQILELAKEVSTIEIDERYLNAIQKLDELTKIRTLLSECKNRESNVSAILPGIISGVIGISATMLILKHEEEDIITTKAYNIVLGLLGRR